MTNTLSAPASSTRRTPRSITTARVLWIAVAVCSAIIAATSLLMLAGAMITGMTLTAAGGGLVGTVITVLFAASVSWFSVTSSKELRAGDAEARRILTILAVGLLVAALVPAAGSVLGGVTTGLAVLAAASSWLPSASRYLHPRRNNG